MPAYSNILRSVSAEKFSEILGASPRKAKEVYFHRHSIKAKSQTSRMPKPGAKNEERTAALYEVILQDDDDQMAEEILRVFLLGKRDLLAKALDHLGIPHQNGLTDSDDVSKIAKLSVKELKALAKALDGVATPDEVRLYLGFMGAEEVEKVFS